MKRRNIINISVFVLIVLGIVMIYFGGFYAPKLMIPPILTGIGFFVIAWAFSAINRRKRTGRY